MVPLQNTHAVNGVIESDRMLLVSGALADSSFGIASSALFDGSTFIPYIMSSSSSGAPGLVASLFHSISNFSFTQHRKFYNAFNDVNLTWILDYLTVGVVILISIAIAAGVVFFLALIGILWTLFSRRDDKLGKFDGVEDDDDDSTHHRPSSLLDHINAATRNTILGTPNPFGLSGEKDDAIGAKGGLSPDLDPFAADGSNYLRAETPSDAAAGGILAADEESSRPAHARYSFDGTGEGELPLSAGLEVEVLDDRDSACVLRQLFTTTVLIGSDILDGGMHEMSAQVAKVLSQQPICTRFLLPLPQFVSRFRLHTTYPLHEIDLDVHGTVLQVVPFLYQIILPMSILHRFLGWFALALHLLLGSSMKIYHHVRSTLKDICWGRHLMKMSTKTMCLDGREGHQKVIGALQTRQSLISAKFRCIWHLRGSRKCF
jgi:hypothetical protein